jgi:fatty acid desaturase
MDIIDDVRAHRDATGTPAAAEFGPADDYAKQFPKQKRRTLGQAIMTAGVAAAIAYLALTILLLLFQVDVRDYIGPITMLPAAILVLASLLVGFLTDYFKPLQSSRVVQ